MAEHKLTERQRKFVDAYLELGNATKAATAAGFAPLYAAALKRNPAVMEYMEERRKQMPVHNEVMNFLIGVMRGQIKTSHLRTDAAVQIGIRAGLWKDKLQYEKKIKEAMKYE